MLYFHALRGADAGAKINNPRGAVRTRQNIPKPHRVHAVRGAVDICTVHNAEPMYLCSQFGGKVVPHSGLCEFQSCALCHEVSHHELFKKSRFCRLPLRQYYFVIITQYSRS